MKFIRNKLFRFLEVKSFKKMRSIQKKNKIKKNNVKRVKAFLTIHNVVVIKENVSIDIEIIKKLKYVYISKTYYEVLLFNKNLNDNENENENENENKNLKK